jgi:hypothetical protein
MHSRLYPIQIVLTKDLIAENVLTRSQTAANRTDRTLARGASMATGQPATREYVWRQLLLEMSGNAVSFVINKL